ncbi:MAG TPA: hypothetical protein VFD43_08080, partial [Planctomycetota bacterium]|nr:hypothetical protein [Planctomycetota bacterium]
MIATPVSTRTLSAPARRWLLALLLLAPVARGHSPHDVANMVRVSPDFTDDQTVFAAFLLTEHDLLGRSRDAGRSWELMAPPWVLGDFSAIEISPGFALDRTLFASSPTLGVFRSTDGGDSWAPVNAGLTDLRVSGLALSPGFAGDGVLLAVTESGCFRSADGGDSWVDASAGIVTVPLMAVHFASDSVAFAGGTVLHRSDDGGQTWAPVQVFSVPIATIAASPAFATDTSLTVCFGRYGNGIQISLDGGMNWAPWTLGLTDDFVNELSFAADGTVFAVTKEEGCFRAPGLGEPFSLLVEGFEHHSPLTPNHYLSVSVSPAYPVDQTVFVAAFEGLHRSQNGGELWVQQDVYTQRINRRIDVRRKGGGLELLLGNYGSGLQISHPIFEELGAAPEGAQPLGAAGGVAPGGGGHGPGLAGAPALSAQPALGPPTGLAWTPRADGL